MNGPRFFVDLELEPGEELVLPAAVAHHVSRVLRLTTGSKVVLFNGLGGEHVTRLVSIDAKGRRPVVAFIESFDDINRESPLYTSLGLAIIKRDPMEWALQKATELGVNHITPLISEFTNETRKQSDSRYRHWQRVIQSACEQSGRNSLPVLAPIRSPEDWLGCCKQTVRLILHPVDGIKITSLADKSDSVALAVGPEGGFSNHEVRVALAAGFQSIGLGTRILRAETAPITMLAALQSRWGDFA